MIKVGLVCLVLFFSLAEFYEWGKTLALPMPISGIAGLLLALLSNPNRWRDLLPDRAPQDSEPPQPSPSGEPSQQQAG